MTGRRCLLHLLEPFNITCLGCGEAKTCGDFTLNQKNSSRHRHVCIDCDAAGVKVVTVPKKPEPEPPRFAEWEIQTCEKKTKFDNELDALGSAAHNVKRGKPLSVYQCPVCGYWHKTSKRLRWAVPRDAVRRMVQQVDTPEATGSADA